jgi:hypothetical protein
LNLLQNKREEGQTADSAGAGMPENCTRSKSECGKTITHALVNATFFRRPFLVAREIFLTGFYELDSQPIRPCDFKTYRYTREKHPIFLKSKT